MSEPRLRGWWQIEGAEEWPVEARQRVKDLVADAEREGKSVVTVHGVSLRWHPAPDSLDAAWAEAEAALSEGWTLGGVIHRAVARHPTWSAEASSLGEGALHAEGDTPAAALRALTAKLRERHS